jgi:cytochrome c553
MKGVMHLVSDEEIKALAEYLSEAQVRRIPDPDGRLRAAAPLTHHQ